MKRWRTIAAVVALLSVLLNAALVVRQSASALESQIERAGLLAALGVICHGDGSASLPSSDRPDLPPVAPKSGDCPVCMGLCTAVAVLADLPVPPALVLDPPSARVRIVSETIRERTAGVRPPPRGPPSIA